GSSCGRCSPPTQRSSSSPTTPRPRPSTLFPYTTLFRSEAGAEPPARRGVRKGRQVATIPPPRGSPARVPAVFFRHSESRDELRQDRKSTRLNSSHVKISYAVFCLKKKNDRESQTSW